MDLRGAKGDLLALLALLGMLAGCWVLVGWVGRWRGWWEGWGEEGVDDGSGEVMVWRERKGGVRVCEGWVGREGGGS